MNNASPRQLAQFGPVLAILLQLCSPASAQLLTVLHTFKQPTGALGTNSDGANPAAKLIQAGNRLYGTSRHGGAFGSGNVFSLNLDGTGFSNLHSFGGLSGSLSTNLDGAVPEAGLVVSADVLYGTTSLGGPSGSGTLFQLRTDGTGFEVLHSFSPLSGPLFTNSDGAHPVASLLLMDSTLYGTARDGGFSGNGTVFAQNLDQGGFSNLHSFSAAFSHISGLYTNLDGANPFAGLVAVNGQLYGAAVYGGRAGQGTIFKLSTNGASFLNLHDFSFVARDSFGRNTNADGANPTGTLISSGGKLYGTAQGGGRYGFGALFSLNTNGSAFTSLHGFSGNQDGANPASEVLLAGQSLYVTTGFGGPSGSGVIDVLNLPGTTFTNFYGFSSTSSLTNAEGAGPVAGLIQVDGSLYGTSFYGGPGGSGTIYSLAPIVAQLPALVIEPGGAMVALRWPVTVPRLSLQSSANLGSSAFWTNLNSIGSTADGVNSVTIPVSNTASFYRLKQ